MQNPFWLWMQRLSLRKVDVARSWGVSEAAVQRYCRDDYWPATREAALRMVRFTACEVTPNDLLGPDLCLPSAFATTTEYRLGQAAIKAALQRKEKRDGKKEGRVA